MKKYACNDCGARFVESSKLSRHLLTHTGVRDYQCPHCSYAAADNYKLKRHMRSHTGEKPYQCHICKTRWEEAICIMSRESGF